MHFCTQKYSTRVALGRFEGEVIRVKSGNEIVETIGRIYVLEKLMISRSSEAHGEVV